MITKKTLGKRILSLALTILMVVGLIPLSAANVYAAEVELADVGYTPTPYDGVPVTPQKITSSNYAQLGLTSSNWSGYKNWFAIRDAKELYGYANLVNGGNTGAKAVLLNDIVVNENVSPSSNPYQWSIISPEMVLSKAFRGTIDGNGHYISGLYYEQADKRYAGLVGFGKEFTIKNLTLKNSYFSAQYNLGGFCGFATLRSNITNCRVMSDVSIHISKDEVGGIAQRTLGSDYRYRKISRPRWPEGLQKRKM